MIMLKKTIKLTTLVLVCIVVTACTNKSILKHEMPICTGFGSIPKPILMPVMNKLFLELEKKQALKTIQRSLKMDQLGKDSTQAWKSMQRRGVGGTSKVVKQYVNQNGQDCRVVDQVIYEPLKGSVSALQEWCQQDSGKWVPSS